MANAVHLDWRNPWVRLLRNMTTPVRETLGVIGRWEDLSAEELECVQKDQINVAGERSAQRRIVYKIPRAAYQDVQNLGYNEKGLASVDGQIIARYSIRRPSTAEIFLNQTRKPISTIECGTVIESETPYTYGDWVGDCVHSLINADGIIEPLILPAALAKKAYVIRDVEALGLKYIVVETPVEIKNARILRKRIPSYYWGPQDVKAYRTAFNVTPPPARENSIIYLGRFNTRSEAVQRHYPSEIVARIVESIGGKVFDTREASPAQFDRLAPEMETVIADQGSALFGVMHAQTKNVIELAHETWWHNANLFIADGAGVENYSVIHVNDKIEAQLHRQIVDHLHHFGALR